MKNPNSQSGFFKPRILLALALCSAGVFLGMFSFAATPPVATPNALPLAAGASLSFEERVAGQRAIEEIYWRHRTWSADNTSTKPPLSQVLPEAALREKVTDTLRMSNALDLLWHEKITGEQLQAEIDRMAAASKQPERLREIWAALGNDPHLIAECLARPQLADRLIRAHYSNDPRFNAAPRERAHADRTHYGTVGEMRQMSGTYNVVRFTKAAPSETATGMKVSATQFDAMIQEIASAFGADGGWPRPREDGRPFDRSPAIGAPPVGHVSDVREEADRFSVVSVLARDQDHIELASVEWPKVSFDAWWRSVRDTITIPVDEPQRAYRVLAASSNGAGSGGGQETHTFSAATEQWQPIAGMDAREDVPNVWTGSEMLVWGGSATWAHTDGGRYDPATDTWRPISVIGAPTPRYLGAMNLPIWTGKEMIIWGGFAPGCCIDPPYFNDGARYDPATDTWTPMTTTGAPEARDSATAVWTGTEMIVWGGWRGDTGFKNTGGRYDPSTDTWRPTSTNLAPKARFDHTAVWTGSRMIVWGGSGWCPVGDANFAVCAAYAQATGMPSTDDLNDGGIYDPATDSWKGPTVDPATGTVSPGGTSLVNAPSKRYYHTAVWTGTEMLIWGGRGHAGYDSVGGRYNPATDTWRPTSTVNVPSKRKWHVALWSGTEMLIWGGSGPGGGSGLGAPIGDGGRYDPVTDTWVTISDNGRPPPSEFLAGVWTGSEMIVWGGTNGADGDGGLVRTGARYNPGTDTWRPMNMPAISQLYDGPFGHSAVWTGSEMIIWGGRSGNGLTLENKGGVYVPSTDTWRPTTTVGAPDPRYSHTAVWTGNEMIVWGGFSLPFSGSGASNTGARYNPATDTWTVTSITGGTPSQRGGHTAVWTGGKMIVWGGLDGSTANNSGGRYDPATDTWQSTSATGAPTARYSHSAVWTGSKMIAWGGLNGSTANSSGGRYDPATDAWQPTGTTGAPGARSSHTAIWTGTRMIVWGGGSYSGGRYDPAADTWQPMSASGYSGGVIGDTAVWTGSEMIAWGGGNSGGGRYDPAADTWQPTSIPRFLLGRSYHSAIWTGSSMIVFGGFQQTTTGAAYILGPNPPIPTSVVSRKIHGSAGTFDINLPLTGTRGVECRSGGANGNYTVVFTFLNNITNCGTAGTVGGTVSSGPNLNQCTENLTGVPNAQYITVTLTGVTDVAGKSGSVSATMGVLIGDVNATGLVDGNDVSAVQGQARQTANSTNFRLDVNTTGLIDGNDVSLVQSKTRSSLPSPP